MSVFKTIGKGIKAIGSGLGALNPFISIGSGILGGILGYKQYKESKRQFKVQQDFAEQQLGWQQQSGSMQHRVEDMLAAGLHPTLAVGGSSGGGVVQSAQPTSRAQSIMEQALAGAQLGMMNAQMKNLNADTLEKKASAEEKKANARGRNIDSDIADTLGRQEIEQRIALGQASIDEIRRNLDSGLLSEAYLSQVIEEMKARTAWLKEQTGSSEEATRIATETFNYESARLEHNLKKLLESNMHESQLSGNIGLIRGIIAELSSSDPTEIKEAISKLKDNIIDMLPAPVQWFIRRNKGDKK